MSCTLCHQIAQDGLGTRESFTGRHVINGLQVRTEPSMLGSFAVDTGRASVTRSSTGRTQATAVADVAVLGAALEDDNFGAAGDRVRFLPNIAGAAGPFQIEVELRYQPIAFRWAQNLKRYDAEEPRRFTSFYDATARDSSVVLARSAARVP